MQDFSYRLFHIGAPRSHTSDVGVWFLVMTHTLFFSINNKVFADVISTDLHFSFFTSIKKKRKKNLSSSGCEINQKRKWPDMVMKLMGGDPLANLLIWSWKLMQQISCWLPFSDGKRMVGIVVVDNKIMLVLLN